MNVSSTDTIFVNETSVDLSSIVFSAGSTTECSRARVLVLAAPIRYFTVEGSPHSVLKNLWLGDFPEGSVCPVHQLQSLLNSWGPGISVLWQW